MCGVVAIVYDHVVEQLGREASALLKKLEYRGYDSTGAAFFQDDGSVVLKKKVGSPTRVVRQLELERDQGHKFIGQVRWATYGSVTDVNAQPHRVSCRVKMVGAHNGNISNTDTLKEFLADNGHDVLSDNDGEMLVHVVEHYYDEVTRGRRPRTDATRIKAVMRAVRRAQRKVEGSYAACVAFPDLPGVFAMKSGSSLYAGKGSDAAGEFVVVSSDLTSVLSKTRYLIPLSEGEGIYFTHDEYRVFSLSRNSETVPRLKRSRLNIADISLHSRYRFFMHQEIYTAAENVDRLLQYYFMDEDEEQLYRIFEAARPACKEIVFDLLKLYDIFDRAELKTAFDALAADPRFADLVDAARKAGFDAPKGRTPLTFTSDEAQLLGELAELGRAYRTPLWLLDRIVIWKKKRKTTWYRDEMAKLLRRARDKGGRLFTIGAGTSYHACLVGAYLFHDIAKVGIVPVNPGMFRSMYLDALSPNDIVLGVTQSGETKDLLDIFNDVRERYGDRVKLISMVNNELSTIPQEKSDFFLPILCGPEIAVAATKSFISQVALLHLLACITSGTTEEAEEQIARVRTVIDFTLRAVEEDIAEVALKMFLKPSLHILGTSLIGLAKEGALKIREVVLNHTEGYDAAEFKHGPNTILGKNTIFSLGDLEHLLMDAFELFGELDATRRVGGKDATLEGVPALLKDVGFREMRLETQGAGARASLPAVRNAIDLYRRRIDLENYFSNYPLIFFCPPDERDIQITISQIHTHKIRGADIVLIARDNEQLRKAVEGVPAGFDHYYCKYIRVPTLFDKNMFVYQAAVALQLLAFRMSVDKMKYLNKSAVENHGVHPDVPKNVSKSITVD